MQLFLKKDSYTILNCPQSTLSRQITAPSAAARGEWAQALGRSQTRSCPVSAKIIMHSGPSIAVLHMYNRDGL